MAQRDYSPAVKEAINLVERENDLERIIRTAKENLCIGRFTEPRWFYDEVPVPVDFTIGQNGGDAFKNGEAFPVKITHIMMSLRATDVAGGAVDPRLIQRVGVKLVYHGQEYMAREFAAAPLWLSKVVAAPDPVAFGQSSHCFFEPWLLTARDTMRIRVQLLTAPSTDQSRKATISMTGFGLDSRRPYFKSADIDLTNTVIGALDPALFRNDGDEPIVMTHMSAHLGAEPGSNNPQGDIGLLRVQINQVGNGTNSEWFKHSTAGGTPELMLAQNIGTHTGRVIVHEFDDETPFYWEPGEGLNIQTQALSALGVTAPVLAIALAGTIVIT